MGLEKTVRLRITGEVQGVGYRIWATRTASGLGLRGWVRNRKDGSVEVLATGAADAVAAMTESCRRGPSAARVAKVTVSDAEDGGSRDFSALPTE
jgi:acylphosphatase